MEGQKKKDIFPLIIMLIGVVSILVGAIVTIIVYKINSLFFDIMVVAGIMILIAGLFCEFYTKKPSTKVEEKKEEKE